MTNKLDEFTFFSVKEFANRLDLEAKTIKKWINDKKIKAVNVGSEQRKIWRIPSTELLRLHKQAYLED